MDGLLVMIFKSLKSAIDLPRDVYELLLKMPLMKIEKELIIPYLFSISLSQKTDKFDILIQDLILSEDSRINISTGLHFKENTQLIQSFSRVARQITIDLFDAIETFYIAISDSFKLDDDMLVRFDVFNYLIIILSFHLDYPKLPPRSSEHILNMLFIYSKKHIGYLEFIDTLSIKKIYTELSKMKKISRKYGLYDNKYFKESLITLTGSIYYATSDLELDQNLQTSDRKRYKNINSQLSIMAEKITHDFSNNIMDQLASIPHIE
jgi:hypothetical protein